MKYIITESQVKDLRVLRRLRKIESILQDILDKSDVCLYRDIKHFLGSIMIDIISYFIHKDEDSLSSGGIENIAKYLLEHKSEYMIEYYNEKIKNC